MSNAPPEGGRSLRSNSSPTLEGIQKLIEQSTAKILETINTRLDDQANIIQSLVERVEHLERKNEQLELKCKQMEEENSRVQHQQQDIIQEINDRNSRRSNLIISGTQELKSGSVEERRKYDTETVSKVMHYLNLSDDYVVSTQRIGSRNSDSRLLRIVCIDPSKKAEILRQATSLRRSDDFRGIYINPDLTPTQRKEAFTLKAELKRRRQAGENVFIRYGNIVKREELRIFFRGF